MKKLRIHYFQHVVYEGLGSIEDWINSSGHTLTSTRFFENPVLPELSAIDWLIIMGGGMSVNDEEKYPWLVPEKQFIRKAVEAGKTVLGICLGSQLVSSALGAKVYKNAEKEIGWFNIQTTNAAIPGSLFNEAGSTFKVFHWHGDTFDLPGNAVHLASSDACKNQAYLFGKKVLALQFHLEPTLGSLQQMIEHGRADLNPGKYVQAEKELTADKQLFESNRKILFALLNSLADQK